VKIWIKRLAWMLALPLALLLGLALWVGFKVLGYEQVDNEAHLAEKAAYLEQLSKAATSKQRPNIVFILKGWVLSSSTHYMLCCYQL
jgi:predicted negative regulator of RcsB-dependent stress response